MSKLSPSDVAASIKPAIRSLGISGQIDVHVVGGHSTTWIGKPGGDDHSIVVIIAPMAKDEQTILDRIIAHGRSAIQG